MNNDKIYNTNSISFKANELYSEIENFIDWYLWEYQEKDRNKLLLKLDTIWTNSKELKELTQEMTEEVTK